MLNSYYLDALTLAEMLFVSQVSNQFALELLPMVPLFYQFEVYPWFSINAKLERYTACAERPLAFDECTPQLQFAMVFDSCYGFESLLWYGFVKTDFVLNTTK